MSSFLRDGIASVRSLSRDSRVLLVSFTLAGFPIGLIMVALPVYVERLGLGSVFAGTFITTVGLTGVAFVIPFGILADRYGRLRMTLLGGVLLVAGMVALALADSAVTFLAAAVVLGTSEALEFSTANALLAEATRAENRASVFGMSFFFNGLGFAAGNFFAVIPDQLVARNPADLYGAYRPAFWAAAAICVAVPVSLAWVRVGRSRTVGGPSLLPRKSAPVLSKFFASNFIIGLGAGLIIPLFSLWFFRKFGLAESVTGPLLAVASLLVGFAYLAAPILARRRGMVRSIVEVQAFATVMLFFIPLVPNIYVVGLLFVLRNLLMNMSWPVASSFLMSTVDESERAAASAVTGASFRLPFAISTTIGGYLLTINLDLPFFVTTALYAVGVATFWTFFRNYREPGAASRIPTQP